MSAILGHHHQQECRVQSSLPGAWTASKCAFWEGRKERVKVNGITPTQRCLASQGQDRLRGQHLSAFFPWVTMDM